MGDNYSFPSPPVTVDRTGVVGKWADITLDAGGNPYITYLDMAQTNATSGGYGAVKLAFMPQGGAWTNGKNWETMTAAIRYRGRDTRLSVESKSAGGGAVWKAAVGYAASDGFRIAYYVE